MALDAQQQEWARILKQHKLTDAHRDAASFEQQKTSIQEDISYFKKQLTTACRKRDRARVVFFTDKLYALRAQQTILALQEQATLFGEVDDATIASYGRQYVRDCATFARAVDYYMNTETL